MYDPSSMDLTPPLEYLASDTASAQVGPFFRFASANFRWEPAVSGQRAAEYGVYVGEVANHPDWKAEHKSYLNSFVQIAKDHPRSAECFMSVNDRAHLNEHLDNTYLLRLESLGYLLEQPLIADVAATF